MFSVQLKNNNQTNEIKNMNTLYIQKKILIIKYFCRKMYCENNTCNNNMIAT